MSQTRYSVVVDETMQWLKDTIAKRLIEELGKLRNEMLNWGSLEVSMLRVGCFRLSSSMHLYDIALKWHKQFLAIICGEVDWVIYKEALLLRFGNIKNKQFLSDNVKDSSCAHKMFDEMSSKGMNEGKRVTAETIDVLNSERGKRVCDLGGSHGRNVSGKKYIETNCKSRILVVVTSFVWVEKSLLGSTEYEFGGVGEQVPADISKQGMGGNELVSNDTFVGIAVKLTDKWFKISTFMETQVGYLSIRLWCVIEDIDSMGGRIGSHVIVKCDVVAILAGEMNQRDMTSVANIFEVIYRAGHFYEYCADKNMNLILPEVYWKCEIHKRNYHFEVWTYAKILLRTDYGLSFKRGVWLKILDNIWTVWKNRSAEVKIIWLKILDCHGLSWVIDSLVGSGVRGRNTWRKVPQFSLMLEDKHHFKRDGLIIMVVSGRVLTSYDRVLASYGRVWPVMAVSGRVWPSLAGYGRVLAGIVGSARYASTLLIILSAKRVEGSFKVPRPYASSMMASIDEDVEKSSLADQDDIGSGLSSSGQNENRKYRDSSGSKNHVTPSSRSSRSGDHRRSRIGVKVGWFQGDILTLGLREAPSPPHRFKP
ncbi:hypothetical protein Tco_0563361 [Tanacetum coccineum]